MGLRGNIRIVCDASFSEGKAGCAWIVTTATYFIAQGFTYLEDAPTSSHAELYAIVRALEDVNRYLRGVPYGVKILSDCAGVISKCKKYLEKGFVYKDEGDYELYMKVLKETRIHKVEFWYVAGHKTKRSAQTVVDYSSRQYREIMS